MINKLQFNNLVISNKKKIRQGQVQTINKLVQKIRKLKAELEKDSDNPKKKKRLRKAVENMEFLKKYKCVDIIKNVLLLEKNPIAVISNPLSAPDEIAIAMLAHNKVITNLIEIFKEQLNLTVGNCKWREELMETSKRRAKMQKTEEKKRKRKEMKEQKAIAQKRLDWIRENNPNSNHASEIITAPTNGSWKVEIVNPESSEDLELSDDEKMEEDKPSQDKHKKSEIDFSGGMGGKSNKLRVNKSKVDVHTNSETTKCKKVRHKNSENDVDSLELKSKTIKGKSDNVKATDFYQNSEANIQDEETNTEDVPETVVTHIVDDFFLTDTGENYLSTAVRRGRSNAPAKKTDEIINNSKQEVSKLDSRSFNKNIEKIKKNRRENVNDTRKQNLNSDQSLHPSWAAKQKLKPIIATFKGKKIVFEDDQIDIANNKENLTNRAMKSKNTSNQTTENLHPSWAAKQKLKPIITTFQGKKTSFVTEDD